jgi:hypothetical protein
MTSHHLAPLWSRQVICNEELAPLRSPLRQSRNNYKSMTTLLRLQITLELASPPPQKPQLRARAIADIPVAATLAE